MNREHYVAGQAPDWTPDYHAFRPLTQREARPAHTPSGYFGPAISRPKTRAQRAAAKNRHDIYVFLAGCGWGVMCAIGMLAAWGIHP